METSQLQFELAVKRLYRKIRSCGSIYDPLSNPLFRKQTEFRGCPGAATRRYLYRRAVRSLRFYKEDESRFAGQSAFDRFQKQFPALSRVKWTAGINHYTIRKDDQGSWSQLLLRYSCPDGFSQLDGFSYIASLTAALGIPLTSLYYTDPIEGTRPLDEVIFKLAKHCKRLRNLSISPDEEYGDPPIETYRGLFPKTLKKLDLPDAQPWNIEIVLSWNLPRLRELTFELKGRHMKNLDWLKPKATRTTECTGLQSVRFDGFTRYSHDLDEPTEAIDPGDMALWLSRTLPSQCRLAVSKTANPDGEGDWARQVEERYLERRQLEREESRRTAR